MARETSLLASPTVSLLWSLLTRMRSDRYARVSRKMVCLREGRGYIALTIHFAILGRGDGPLEGRLPGQHAMLPTRYYGKQVSVPVTPH